MSDSPEHKPVTRRSVLDLLLGIGAVGVAGSAIFPVLRYLTPRPQTSGGGPIKLTAEDRAKLAGSDRFVIVRAGNRRIIVFSDERLGLRALSAKCTHEGCIVQYSPGESIVWCACHNGHFDLDGRVLSGPPPKPLAEFPVRQEKSGEIIVEMESA